MDQDETFLSFSQDPDSSAFINRFDNESVLASQVGRDAQSRQFSPAPDPSLLQDDILRSVEKPRALNTEFEDALGDKGGIDFGFEDDFGISNQINDDALAPTDMNLDLNPNFEMENFDEIKGNEMLDDECMCLI
jgi:hypothetical protein